MYNLEDEAFMISSFAVQAMLYEVACYPSPGLVSAISKGSHKDMDFYTFIDSTSALIKPLTLCAQEGFSKDAPIEIFNRIRKIGIKGEEEMFQKTLGVNTHKGMLFLMGICCAACGKVVYEKGEFSQIKYIIKDMTCGIVQNELGALQCKNELSHGEKLFLKYKIKGVRGQVEEGLPIVFEYSLPLYKSLSDLSKNDRLIHTLIGIMQYSEDSNIIHRHSIEVLKEVQKKAKEAIDLGGMTTDEGRKTIAKMDVEFNQRRISPGGSADLLSVTAFLHMIEKNVKTQ